MVPVKFEGPIRSPTERSPRQLGIQTYVQENDPKWMDEFGSY